MTAVTGPAKARSRGRQTAWAALLVVLVLVTAVLPLLLTGGQSGGRTLDPDDTSLNGSAALARLLEAHGVEVTRVETPGAAVAAAGPHTLLLVTEASFLDRAAAGRVSAAFGDRLIVGFVPYLDVLAPGVRRQGEARTRSRAPECALREAVRAGNAYTGGVSLTGPSGATGCYPAGDGHTMVRYTLDGHTVTVLGDASFMTNLRLAEDGNAALALNLAGARQKLIWLAEPDDPAEAGGPGDPGEGADGQARSLGDLIPRGVKWAVLQLAVAVAPGRPVARAQARARRGRAPARGRAGRGDRGGARTPVPVPPGQGPGRPRAAGRRGRPARPPASDCPAPRPRRRSPSPRPRAPAATLSRC
ncbi:DUF4350 domain-containing protein [Microbispora sp. GKU 823]|uniref:DUF4350 domain-containing protein n=1 Tax=Microbispora sp. GKU 823 TaxID=1652100 RepID=UPI00117D135D|nr:DUF4350 domain-containing protein [Microbispora sp. GKU 823]